MRAKQQELFPSRKYRREHGGEESKGRRKVARPISTRKPMHLTLRSERAQGRHSMLDPRNRPHVERILNRLVAKHGLKLYRFANVGNHLQLVVRAYTRESFKSFLREFTGAISLAITGARKGNPFGKFWDELAYSRVVEWGKDFEDVCLYVVKNLFEAAGLYTAAMRARKIRPVRLRP